MAPVIQLRGLRHLCVCGALDFEQGVRQPYEFDVDIHAGDLGAVRTDELHETIDYGSVLDRIASVVRDESFQLLECMGQRVAEAILDDDRIESVTIEVRKLRPPVEHDLASSGMRLTVQR